MKRSAALSELVKLKSPKKAKVLQGFFKTGKGEYGEGDIFLGITVPQVRSLAKRHLEISDSETAHLLHSEFHEARLLALVILTENFKRAKEATRKKIFRLYLKHRARINNWDLVDVSAPQIVGTFLLKKPRAELYRLSQSKSLWDRRIAIVSTFSFIRRNDFKETLTIAEKYLTESHDLMHKATGWMLREVGKRDVAVLKSFLEKHHRVMPRTMLRYAIEHLSAAEKTRFMRR